MKKVVGVGTAKVARVFFITVNRNRSGKHKKYTIVAEPFCEGDDEDMEGV